jgi:molecular chaperone IbpA
LTILKTHFTVLSDALRMPFHAGSQSQPARPHRRAQLVTLLKENVTMFDFTPLYRSTVGFDRLARMLDEASAFEAPTYPPYNIERLSDDEYRITMAVAGFGPADINIEVKGNGLTVSGKKPEAKPEAKTEYLHQGIAARAFERRFQVADHVQVQGADMENGLLHISLKREVPEAMKPRSIPVNGVVGGNKVLEARKAA